METRYFYRATQVQRDRMAKIADQMYKIITCSKILYTERVIIMGNAKGAHRFVPSGHETI